MGNRFESLWRLSLGAAVLFGLCDFSSAQPVAFQQHTWRSFSGEHLDHYHVLVPNLRRRAFSVSESVEVTGVTAKVRILENTARTTLEVGLKNHGVRPAQAELLLPVPAGAAVGGFFFEGGASGATAKLLPAAEARRTYDQIVAKLKDPALLEFAGMSAVRSSVFPVPAQGTQRVRLVYDEILEDVGGRLDYELPRTASLGVDVPWSFAIDVVQGRGLATIYSPTHVLRESARSQARASLTVADRDAARPGSFRLHVITGRQALSGSILAWPETGRPGEQAKQKGGAFLLVAGLGAEGLATPAIAREVTLVLDRSGSMGGTKFDQAREAARQVIEGLGEGERFRIVDFSDQVAASSSAPVAKTTESMEFARQYLAGLSPAGGTNISGALVEALRPNPEQSHLGLVLFLTDGLPTVGIQDEHGLNAAVAEANAYGHRIFPFGVGDGVNVPLLDKLAVSTKGKSSYVRPGEDVEVAVGDVFRRLKGPRLADLEIEILDESGNSDTTLVRDMLPADLPDLFEGDQLVLLGRYTEAKPLSIRVTGRSAEGRRSFVIRTDLGRAHPKNDFVPRLWASRRIAVLMDSIRQSVGAGQSVQTAMQNTRTQELADEVLRLSTRYGVLSEYTAFLALEGTQLGSWAELSAMTCQNLVTQNTLNRSGAVAVNGGLNISQQRTATSLNPHQNYLNANGQQVRIGNNQQVAGGLALLQGNTWVEGQLLDGQEGGELPEAEMHVQRGSDEFDQLLDELIQDRRNGLAALSGEVLFQHRGQLVRLASSEPAPVDQSVDGMEGPQ